MSEIRVVELGIRSYRPEVGLALGYYDVLHQDHNYLVLVDNRGVTYLVSQNELEAAKARKAVVIR